MRFLLALLACLPLCSGEIPLPRMYDKVNGVETVVSGISYTLAMFNDHWAPAEISLSFRDANNNSVAVVNRTVPPFTASKLPLSGFFSSETRDQIARIFLEGDAVHTILLAHDTQGERLSATWPTDATVGTQLLASHVAIDRALFYTGFALHSDRNVRLTWDDGPRFMELNAQQTNRFELTTLYGSSIPIRAVNAFTADDPDSQLTGLQTFGTWDGTKRFAMLPLSFTTNRRLVFPHIAEDLTSFWTGMIAANPNTVDANIEVRFWASDGALLQTQNYRLIAGGRLSIIYDRNPRSFPVLPQPLPASAAWCDVVSDQPLAGFELFGSPQDYMEGIRASGEPWQEAIMPYIHTDSRGWMGIALVNAVQLPTTVSVQAYSSSGTIIKQTEFDLQGHEKKVTTIQELTGLTNLADISALRFQAFAGQGIFGLALFGDGAGKTMGGYELVPLAGRTAGAVRTLAALPRLGVNFPAFEASPGVTPPGQEALQNEMAWWSAGHPGRVVTRQMQDRDVFWHSFDPNDATSWDNRKRWLLNDEGFGVMPTLIGQNGIDWYGPGSDQSEVVDTNIPEHVTRLENYVTDVLTAYPSMRYFEVLNEVISEHGSATQPNIKRINFARILRTVGAKAKAIDPTLTLSLPHFLGTVPDQVASETQATVELLRDWPELSEHYDVYGLHYYGKWEDFNATIKTGFLDRMTAGDLPTKPWVLSETGVSNSSSSDTVTALNGIVGTQRRQAAYVVKMPTLAWALGAEVVLMHTVQSGATSGSWAGFGLIGPNNERTPASCTFRLFSDETHRHTSIDVMSEGENNLWLYRFRDAAGRGKHAYIAWSDQTIQATLNLEDLASQEATVLNLVAHTCPGNAGDFVDFNPFNWFNRQSVTFDGTGALTLSVGEDPLLIKAGIEEP